MHVEIITGAFLFSFCLCLLLYFRNRSFPHIGRFANPLNSPLVLRSDSAGCGSFGAPRAGWGPKRKNKGIEFLATKEQLIYAPMAGIVYNATAGVIPGIEIVNNNLKITITNAEFFRGGIRRVNKGQLIGWVANSFANNPGVKNHIHIELRHNNKITDPSNYFIWKY